MEDQTVAVYTLSKESLKQVKAFSQKHDGSLSEKSKTDLNALRAFFKAGDHKSAQRALESHKNRLRRSLRAPLWKEFAEYELRLDERHALRQHIPPDLDDFTFYLSEEPKIKAMLSLLKEGRPARDGARRQARQPGGAQRPEEAARFSYEGELWLWDESRGKVARGRAQACSCYRGGRWGVTFRLTQQWPKESSNTIFLNTVEFISEMLGELVFEKGSRDAHGLIVITGRTAACKSQIAHKLIESRLAGTSGRHLPTFEDPIERDFEIPHVHYTPREKGKDVSGLEEAINNALRQKPTVLFVGETRDTAEWKLLVNFAGTGHLVVTTVHAGSLVEAMVNILQATGASEPAARSVVGERLLAVIHLRPESITCKDGSKVGILIPSLWRRTPEGIKALMAEGLSSLVPHTARPLSRGGREGLPSSIGRYWFARELLEDKNLDCGARKVLALDEGAREKIKTDALEWDLEGV